MPFQCLPIFVTEWLIDMSRSRDVSTSGKYYDGFIKVHQDKWLSKPNIYCPTSNHCIIGCHEMSCHQKISFTCKQGEQRTVSFPSTFSLVSTGVYWLALLCRFVEMILTAVPSPCLWSKKCIIITNTMWSSAVVVVRDVRDVRDVRKKMWEMWEQPVVL